MKRQTRTISNRLPERACGFDSRIGKQSWFMDLAKLNIYFRIVIWQGSQALPMHPFVPVIDSVPFINRADFLSRKKAEGEQKDLRQMRVKLGTFNFCS